MRKQKQHLHQVAMHRNECNEHTFACIDLLSFAVTRTICPLRGCYRHLGEISVRR